MKIVDRIRFTATQEVEAEAEDYVAAREQLLASISEGVRATPRSQGLLDGRPCA